MSDNGAVAAMIGIMMPCLTFLLWTFRDQFKAQHFKVMQQKGSHRAFCPRCGCKINVNRLSDRQ